MDRLKEAAFEYLLLNPGSDFGDWQWGLINDYPILVVDALGNEPEEVYAELSELWESEYEDERTGVYKDFKDWANVFCNESAVYIYNRLVEACETLRLMGIK